MRCLRFCRGQLSCARVAAGPAGRLATYLAAHSLNAEGHQSYIFGECRQQAVQILCPNRVPLQLVAQGLVTHL